MPEEKPIQVEYGDWLPDLPAYQNPGSILAKNCIPRAKSYRDFRSLFQFTDALDMPALGSFWARQSNDTIFNFAGDQTKLYALTSGTTWSDVSQALTTYSADFWDFLQTGDRIIATDGGATDLQYYDMGTSSTFLDLPGTPPRFKSIALIRDFIIGCNWSFGGDVEPGGFAWSAFNNSEIWTPSLATQANRIPSRGAGGKCQRIVPGRRGIAFREQSVVLIDYVGPPTVFNVDEVIVNHGTQAPQSVCWTRQHVFYYSTEGFMMLDRNTLQVTPIGAGKVNNWFSAELAAETVGLILGAVDRRRGLVFWAFKTSSGAVDYNRILCFNWIFQRWSYAEIDTQFIGEFSSVGLSLDDLDSIFPDGIDLDSIPVDSDAFIGGALSFLAFNGSNQACTFDGTALVAEIDTKEMAAYGRRSFVPGVRPIVDGMPSNVEVAPYTRSRVVDNPVLGNYSAINAIGMCDLRVDARYHRYRTRITGGFDHAQAVEYPPMDAGER